MNKSLRWAYVLAGLLLSSAAYADTYPSKPIKAVNPFGAGSAGDVVPRLFFERLGIELGQPIVIENRVGGGGSVGTGAVAKAIPTATRCCRRPTRSQSRRPSSTISLTTPRRISPRW